MKLLSLHCDYIKFKPLKKALRKPEELSKAREEEITVKDPLVILTAIEKQDETNSSIVKQYTKEIENLAKQVNAKNIVLYPYAHLSSSLSKPDFALKTLEQADKLLSKNKSLNISRAPFGFYKSFELKCKGHPLSELSREINNEGKTTDTTNEKETNQNTKQLLRETSVSFEVSVFRETSVFREIFLISFVKIPFFEFFVVEFFIFHDVIV
jgi:threonyl-tRNA synthetase